MTSAPHSASTAPAEGTNVQAATSSTRTPLNTLSSEMTSSLTSDNDHYRNLRMAHHGRRDNRPGRDGSPLFQKARHVGIRCGMAARSGTSAGQRMNSGPGRSVTSTEYQ